LYSRIAGLELHGAFEWQQESLVKAKILGFFLVPQRHRAIAFAFVGRQNGCDCVVDETDRLLRYLLILMSRSLR